MISGKQQASGAPYGGSKSDGLCRTLLAGPGRSLEDVFTNLERAPLIERVLHHPKREVLGARVTLTPEEGNGYWEFTRIRDDIRVVVWSFAYKNPRFELVPGDGWIQFCFRVTGDLTLAVSRVAPVRFNRPSLLVWAQSRGVEIPEWTAPSSRERMVAISVRPDFLIEHFVSSVADMPPQLQSFVSNPTGKLNYFQLPMTAQMFDIATKLIDNPFKGALALVHTEALTLELLCAAVGSFCSPPGSATDEYTERELRCLESARDKLMRQLAPAPTIQKLARSIGMAETAMTKGFKAVYGETILDFSLHCRMQCALTLLRDRHWSVDRVSGAVGYSHSTSFATAFRRHFGVRPIDVRRLKSS
jgi:AraC-like DNA-binding protein